MGAARPGPRAALGEVRPCCPGWPPVLTSGQRGVERPGCRVGVVERAGLPCGRGRAEGAEGSHSRAGLMGPGLW